MNWIAEYVGKPYVLDGRDDHGLDCWGLVRAVYMDRLDIELPDYGMVSAADSEAVAQALAAGAEAGPWRKVDKPMAMDVVGLWGRVNGKRMMNHVGVYVGGQSMLHSQAKTLCCIERIDRGKFAQRVAGFWRYVG